MNCEKRDMQEGASIIKAVVEPRLLEKASRLFTGSLEGRIVEILQNARRAGATEIEIENNGERVSVKDNGSGITDFQSLLSLGRSGWDERFEASEDPAGVGLFSLAPRSVTVQSNGKKVVIDGKGWQGEPVRVVESDYGEPGTFLSFNDKPWTLSDVERQVVFTGLKVRVDGTECSSEQFIQRGQRYIEELGCRIQIRPTSSLSKFARPIGLYGNSWMVVNFHGQLVSEYWKGLSDRNVCALVELTGEATDIRLMLPGRTRLIENNEYLLLKEVIEREAFIFVKESGEHRLAFEEYEKAQKMGVELPEARPTYSMGLLYGDTPEPVEVTEGDNFDLERCHRRGSGLEEVDEANAHLLAALSSSVTGFKPVTIRETYSGYSWAKLPEIKRVLLSVGEKLQEEYMGGGVLRCVDGLAIRVETSDGLFFDDTVCMGVMQEGWEDVVLVTPDARDKLWQDHIWYHLGGYCDEGDTYETQQWEMEKALDEFWRNLVGPYESLRMSLVETVRKLERGWGTVTIHPDGMVLVKYEDGSMIDLREDSRKK